MPGSPFSNLDLISCRNVLIYLEPAMQKRVIPLFHYALNPSGMLALGSSESIGTFTDLFAQVDKKQKIFSKRVTALRQAYEFPSQRVRRNRRRRLSPLRKRSHLC